MQGLISWLFPAKVNASANVKVLGMHWSNQKYVYQCWYWPDEVDRVSALMWKKCTLNILPSSMSEIHSVMTSHSDLWPHVTLQKNSSEFHKVRYAAFQFGKKSTGTGSDWYSVDTLSWCIKISIVDWSYRCEQLQTCTLTADTHMLLYIHKIWRCHPDSKKRSFSVCCIWLNNMKKSKARQTHKLWIGLKAQFRQRAARCTAGAKTSQEG